LINIKIIESNPRLFIYFGLFIAIYFINPLLSIFLIGLIGIFDRIPLQLSLFSAVIFSFFIVFRSYGIDWSETGTDDAPVYFDIIRNIGTHSFNDIWFRVYPEIEIIPKIIWWILYGLFESIGFILIFQSVFWVLSIWMLSYTVSKKYYASLFVIGMLLLPNIFLINILNLYRSAWAMFFINLTYIFVIKNNRLSIIFGVMATLCHTASLTFVSLLILSKKNNVKYAYIILLSLLILLLYFYLYDIFLIFHNKFSSYLDPVKTISLVEILKNSIFFLLFLYFYSNSPRMPEHKIAILSISLALFLGLIPAFYDIYIRLSILYIPSAIIILAGAQKQNIIIVLYGIVFLRILEILFSESSILRYSYGVFPYPLRVPFLDFIYFFSDAHLIFR
jgi:hypothetical protein